MQIDRAQELLQECLDTLQKKNRDYGSANIVKTGANGIAVRLLDKVHRLLNLTNGNNVANYESVADTFKDVTNYGIIGMLLLEGSWEGSIPDLPDTQPENLAVYLAGPIDGIASYDAKNWREYASKRLCDIGCTCFDPTSPYLFPSLAGARADYIRHINRAAVTGADIILAHLGGPGRGLGTIREIEYAHSLGKPVVAILSDDLERSMESHDLIKVRTLDDAIVVIEGMVIEHGLQTAGD